MSEPITREYWEVRHDAFPEPVVFTYTSAEKALEDYNEYKFYDKSTGWGVTMTHIVKTVEVLATTKPGGR